MISNKLAIIKENLKFQVNEKLWLKLKIYF